jgi:hypothetical protein
MSEGTKHDSNKAPLELLPFEALELAAQVMAFGEKKYAAFNWTKGFKYRRLIGAAMRHLNQYNSGEDVDSESNISHVGHALCCLMFLAYMEKHRPELDDRGFKHAKSTLSEAQRENSISGDL